MGLLTVGTPLSWEETKNYADHVRKHGIKQFINLFHRLKNRTNDCLYFGDEVEYTLVRFDGETKEVRLNLKAQYYLEKLRKSPPSTSARHVEWTHEYASYMIEGTPGKPYGALSAHFNTVEDNMRLRRHHVLEMLDSAEESILSITVFPRMGCQPSFTYPAYPATPKDGVSRSIFYPDEAINNSHPRFRTLTRNIRERRGEKVSINVPIFFDVNTPMPFTEDFSKYGDSGESQRAAKVNHIYMDCMGFGMGCSCLQMTFQASNIVEARHLYDQLTPLTPIMMALSAASPIFRGYLADIDHRWSVIAASVDDRTSEERGIIPLKNEKYIISKSRYDSIDSYLSPEGKKYNDIPIAFDCHIYEMLLEGGIDDQLAQHFAHLFIRDPISLFKEKVDVDDETDTDHFENLQSTNWQTMRFKPPPPNSKIGWRVEFRPVECQLTDFENAAIVVFLVMLTRVILSYNLHMLIPISKVDENIVRAQKRDAILHERFFFRKNITTSCSPPNASECSKKYSCKGSGASQDFQPAASCYLSSSCPPDLVELNIHEIINGKDDEFTGLIPFIKDYMDNIEIDVDTRCTVTQYLDFISKRASGQYMTTAKWMREFTQNHPAYKRDSVVSDEIAYDLLKRCDQISKGLATCPELVPHTITKTSSDIPKGMNAASKSKHQRKAADQE